jgi:hypothetical protein
METDHPSDRGRKVSRDLEVVPHGLDVISVINDHVLDRIKVDG